MKRLCSPTAAVLILTLCNALAVMDRQALNLMVEPIRLDQGLSDIQIGLLQGPTFAILFAALGIPFGWLADIRNRRNLIMSGIVVWSVSTAWFGLSTNFAEFFASRIAVAMGEAVLVPCAYSMMADYCRRQSLGRAIAIFVTGAAVGGGGGLALSGMLFGAFTHAGGLDLPVLGHLPAWRATFLSLALPGIGLAAIIWLILREPERVFTASRTKPSPTSVVRHLWAEKQYFLAAFAAYLCFAIIINAFLAWGPTYLIREARMSPAETGRNFGAIMLASGIAGPLLFGWVADLLAKRWSPLMALRGLALVFIGIAGVTWLTFMQGRPNETLWVIAFLSVLVTGPPILATISIQMFTPGHMRGQVSAFSSLLGYVFGVTVGTMGVPLLSTKWAAGLGNAIGIVVIAAASLGAIACLLARAIKAPVEQQSSP